MFKLVLQGIERPLVESPTISADLLNAAGYAVAVLRPRQIEGSPGHHRKRSLQNVRLFFHRGINL